MMKKLGYIFLCMVALWGCQDNADYPFKGKDAVYFQLQTDVCGRKLWIAWFTLLPVKG
ncbi:MAG: hypothetical protein ACLU36_06120 [Barnesiella intestinihominis]